MGLFNRAADTTLTVYDPDGAAHGQPHRRVTPDEYEAAAKAATEKAMAEQASGGRGCQR